MKSAFFVLTAVKNRHVTIHSFVLSVENAGAELCLIQCHVHTRKRDDPILIKPNLKDALLCKIFSYLKAESDLLNILKKRLGVKDNRLGFYKVIIWGNTRADQLAKEGSQLEQLDGGSSYAESKTLVKAAMARKWKRDHPDSDPSDPIHGMTRSQQTIIFRLRSGYNRLRQHMYKRFKVGDSEICPCGLVPQNTEHVLQTCSSHRQLRARTWPNHTPLEKKLYGTTEELALTVYYIVALGLTV